MKLKSILALLLIALVLFLDTAEARRSGGGSRSSGSRSSGSRSSSGSRGSSSRTTRYYSKTTRTAVGGYYRPYGSYVLIVGTPYYDPHYSYYYDGHVTYRGTGGGSSLVTV